MSDADVLYIYVEIYNGIGNHGRFLRAFAAAVVAADTQNFLLLRPVAEELISKYGLQKYLNVGATKEKGKK